jgi:hypothetical protein
MTMKNSLKNKRRISHIKNLMMLALSDGPLSIKEELFIKSRIKSLNLDAKIFTDILKDPESVEFQAPEKLGNKILQMYDMVNLMVIDNNVGQKEIDICKNLAMRMNLMEEVVQQVLKDVVKTKALNLWFTNLHSNKKMFSYR